MRHFREENFTGNPLERPLSPLVVVAEERERHESLVEAVAHAARSGDFDFLPAEQGVNLEAAPGRVAPRQTRSHEGQISVQDDGRDPVPCPKIAVNLCRLCKYQRKLVRPSRVTSNHVHEVSYEDESAHTLGGVS